jgi:fructose-1-phosphate kinase PfkB-like protein
MGALTEHHKCPPRIFRRITDAVSTVGVGSMVGAMICFAIDDRPAGALIIAAAALGAVLAVAVRQAIAGRPS